MNQNMSVDVQSLKTAAGLIKDTGTQYATKIEEMYTEITNMSTYWTGPEYDQMKNVMESYKEDLNKLSTLLKESIPEDILKVVSNYETMKTGITDIANSLK